MFKCSSLFIFKIISYKHEASSFIWTHNNLWVLSDEQIVSLLRKGFLIFLEQLWYPTKLLCNLYLTQTYFCLNVPLTQVYLGFQLMTQLCHMLVIRLWIRWALLVHHQGSPKLHLSVHPSHVNCILATLSSLAISRSKEPPKYFFTSVEKSISSSSSSL